MSYRIVAKLLRIMLSIRSQVLLDVVPALRVAQAGTRLTVYRLLDIFEIMLDCYLKFCIELSR